MQGFRFVRMYAVLLAFVALLPVRLATTRAAEDPKSVFVAVGYGGRRMLSQDGVHWEITAEWAENGGDDPNNLSSVAFGKGRFVAVGGGVGNKEKPGGHILLSLNGKDWKEVKTMPFRVNPVVFGKDRFVVGGTDQRLFWSKDGEKWTEGPVVTPKEYTWDFWFRQGAYGNGRFVFYGNAGKDQKANWVAVSRDGEKIDHFAADLPKLYNLAFGAGRFVGVGPEGVRISSRDGKTWEHKAEQAGDNLDNVVWTGKHFLATGGNTAYTSPDGVAWEKWSAKVPCSVGLARAGLFIGTTWPGQMWSSTDGKEWKKGKPLTPNGINQIV